MSATMQLFMDPVATSCRGLAALCHQLGDVLELERVDISLRLGEHLSPKFRTACPDGKVPTLVHGEFVLTESVAIARYLCGLAASDLAGKGLQGRARVDESLSWIASTLTVPFCQGLVYPQFIAHFKWADAAVAQAALERAQGEVDVALTYLDGRLAAGADFLAGDRLTLADLFGLGVLSMGRMIDFDFRRWPHVSAWMTRVGESCGWSSLERELSERAGAGM